ncbi:hypothetical protein ACQ4PT_050178 [Festuca glaucescens]
MTGLHDKPATSESRRSKRLERSKPEAAAAPPARRARHDEGPFPPRKRECSVPAARRRAEAPVPPPKRDGPVPAARVTRPPSPPYGDQDPGDVTVAPPPAHRAKARLLRPSPEELKRGRTWQTPMCARVGLEYYNSMNQGDQYELAKAVSSNAFVFNGIWFHANFLAKRKGATNFVDLVPKYFFAEIESRRDGHFCVSCVKLDQGDPKNISGCGVCSEKMMHPAGGRYHGAQTRSVRHAPGGLHISFNF